MTRADAMSECERFAREHPDRDVATWLPREQTPGEWVVVRVPRPGRALRPEDLRTGQAADVRPDPAQDVQQEPRVYWA